MTGHEPVAMLVNGQRVQREIEPRRLLVHFLRDDLGLTGTHVGCETSQCGCCVVLLDGAACKSCSLLTVQADGHEVTTIEGLSREGRMHPVQEAFRAAHGLQCGFCTPGMVMTIVDLLTTNQSPTEAEIRDALHGNMCRCTGYQHIVDAALIAAGLKGQA